VPLFNVVVHAPCLPKSVAGDVRPRGFYVPCFVWAGSPTRARAKALERVRASAKALRIAASFESPVPALEIDSVTQIPWYRYFRGQPGWVLYDESMPTPDDTRVA
jgi:hypothetical protein